MVSPLYVWFPKSRRNRPSPVLVRSPEPAITPIYRIRVVLLPSMSIVPPLAPKVIPLFVSRFTSAVVCRVPSFIVKWSAVVDPGTAPNPLSALMLKTPSLIAVDPA